MRATATDVVRRVACVSICVLGKNGRTNRDTVWSLHPRGPKESRIIQGMHIGCRLANTIERSKTAAIHAVAIATVVPR